MKISDTPIAGVKIVEAAPIEDNRGSFVRWYCEKELSPLLGDRHIVQINHSRTMRTGSIRGLHFQKAPHAEMKFIRCLKGRVWDVALDLRAGSPTFLKHHAVELTPASNKMFVIPEGCAHGFQVLEEGSELLYLHTAFYEPSSEGGVHYADPRVNIAWPLPPADLSERDKAYPPLDYGFGGF
jgi:dTDP-4-dehydrorhamnose 3,5-epimerase